jgi:hypothetical protein
MLKFIQTKIFLIILSSLFYTVGISQVLDTEFNGYLSPVAQTGGSAPNFNFQAIYRNDNLDIMGFDTTGFIGNVHIVATNDGKCYKLPLVSLNTPSSNLNAGELISGTVNDPSGELVTLPPGVLAIYKETSNSQLRPYISSLPDELKSCMITLNMITLDNAGSNLPQVSDTYYVSTYGNDSTAKQGFINLPYDNIKKAIDSADGARVHMLEGKWLITATEDSVENADIILNTTSLNLDVDNVDLVSDGDIIVDYDTSTTISDVRLFSSGIGENKVVKFKAPKLQILNKGSQVIRAFNMEGNSKLYVDIDSFSIVKPQIGYSAAIFVGEESIVRLGTVKWGTQDFYNIFNADRDVKKTHYLEIDNFYTLGEGGGTDRHKRAFLLSGRGSLSTGTDSLTSNIILHNVDNDSMITQQMFYRISENGRDINNSTFNLDIGNMTSRMKMPQDVYSYNNFSLFQYFADFEFNRGTLRGSNVNIDIDNYRTNTAAAFYFYGYTLDSTSFNINLGNAEFFNGPLLSDRITGTTNIRNKSVISVHCDNCEFRDSSIVLDVRSTFVVNDDSRLQFSGNYKIYSPGLPAIYSASDIYLNNCTLENDGVSNIIDSPVPITVYVSGAWNASNSPIGSNVTIVKLDEFGEPQLSDTYYIAPYGSDVTGKIGKINKPFATFDQPYVDGKKIIRALSGSYTTDSYVATGGYSNIDIDGNIYTTGGLIETPYSNADTLAITFFEADSIVSVYDGININATGNSELYFKTDYLKTTNALDTGNYSAGFYPSGRKNTVDIGTYEMGSVHGFAWILSDTVKKYTDIDVDNLIVLNRGKQDDGSQRLFWLYGRNFQSVNIDSLHEININIGNLNADSLEVYEGIVFSFSDSRVTSDINYNAKVGNLSYQSFRDTLPYSYNPSDFSSSSLNTRRFGIINLQSSLIEDSNLNFEFGNVKQKGFLSFAYFSTNFSLTNTKLNIDIENGDITKGQLIGNRLSPSTGGTLNDSEISFNCDNCIFRDTALIGQLTSFVLNGTSKINISGRYVITEAGLPAIFSNVDLYLRNCTLENDGVTNIIESNVPITVYVSGAWNPTSAPVGDNVTIVKLDEFGEPQLSDTYFIAPYGSDVTGKIGKRDRPFASINQPYVNGKKYIQTELGNYTTDETLIGEGYTNIKINGSLTSRRPLVTIPFGSSGSTVRFEADSLHVMPTSFIAGSGIFMPDVNDLYFDVRYLDCSLSPFASFDDESIHGFYLGKGNANINIGTMRSVFNRAFVFNDYNTDKNTININIDNFMQLDEPYIPFIGSQQNVFDFSIANSDIAISINNMNLDSFGLSNAYAFKFEDVDDINATINIKNLSVGFNNNGAYTYPHNPFISDIGNLRISFLHFSNNETIANSDIIFNLGQVKYDHVAFIHASGNNGDAILENSDLTFNIDQFYGTDCQLLGNELLNPISGIELINSNLNINCKNCEFADSAMIGQITKYILTGDSKLTFSGKYKVTQAGYPAIFTNTDIYLENCILENDGVTNIIESDSTITVYVSGAWNASNSPIGNNVTIVRLEEFGNTPNKYTSFNTVTSTPATVDVAPNQFTIIDATSGVITYSFTSTNMNVGDRILLKCLNGNTNTITLDPDGATQLFDDSAVNTIDITTAREDLELVWTGTVWNIIR